MTPPATADLADVHDAELRFCELPFISVGGRSAFFGPVRSVSCRDDNALLKQLVDQPGDGAVLLVDGQGSCATALIGDGVAMRAIANGWAGFIVAGAVRDLAGLRSLPIGVKCLAATPRRSAQAGTGRADSVVRLGALTISPGDWVYADDDGVVFADRALPLDRGL